MNKKILVLGAGLTGLTAAYYLNRFGIPVTVLERSDCPGGTLGIGKWEGFTFDAGIHVLHGRDPKVLSFLEDELGIPLDETYRRAFFVHEGKVFPYPFQLNTYCLPLLERLQIFFQMLTPRWGSPSNYGEFLNQNFGSVLCNRFIYPYAEKFWTINPGELTTEWVASRIPRPSLSERVQGLFGEVKGDFGPNAFFRYPQRGGISSLAETLARRLQKQIIYSAEVSRIEPESHSVTCADGRTYDYNICLSTLPLPLTVRLLHPIDAEINQKASRLQYTSIISLSVGIGGEIPHDYHWVYFPSLSEPMARVHFPGNISPYTVPAGCYSLQIEVALRGPVISPEVAPGFWEGCLDRLRKLELMGEKKNVLFVKEHLIEPAYVIYDHYRMLHLPKILEWIMEKSIIPVGRFGEWNYHWMHDSILSGKMAAIGALTRLWPELKDLNPTRDIFSAKV
ncbi:MAG: FAD-dependent oxidoreductase [Bacillota bacterium]|nr:FAD-dependent oxidoreductase [Bacillota bacterium]